MTPEERERNQKWARSLAETEARILADRECEDSGYFSPVYAGSSHDPDWDISTMGHAYLWVAERLRRLFAMRKYGGCGGPACYIGGGPCADCGQAEFELLEEIREVVSP